MKSATTMKWDDNTESRQNAGTHLWCRSSFRGQWRNSTDPGKLPKHPKTQALAQSTMLREGLFPLSTFANHTPFEEFKKENRQIFYIYKSNKPKKKTIHVWRQT